MSDMHEQAASELAGLSDSQLSIVAELAMKQITLEDRIEKGETLLADLKKQHRSVSERELPDALLNTGLSSFRLTDGSRVDVAPFVSANITEAHKEAAFTWLNENGFGSLIKQRVSVSLDRAAETEVARLKQVLTENGFAFDLAETIHPQTLKKLVKDAYLDSEYEGPKPPTDLFSVYLGQRTEIERPKD